MGDPRGRSELLERGGTKSEGEKMGVLGAWRGVLKKKGKNLMQRFLRDNGHGRGLEEIKEWGKERLEKGKREAL